MTRIGYVLKVYPRFSETFIVTELLAREAAGDELAIYALRPTTDARFHPEIARVRARVQWVPRPEKASELWPVLSSGLLRPQLRAPFLELLPALAELPDDEVSQGVALAGSVLDDGIGHLHAHFASTAGRVAWIASRLTGVPFTLTTHAKDIFHESVDRQWLRRICGDAQRVIAISRFNFDHLTRVLDGTGANIVLRYNAIELPRFPYREPRPAGETLRVAAVGRLVPKKGFADLISAADQLVKAGREVCVDIAGTGELEPQLRAQIEELGLAGQVSLLGPRTQEEVRDLIQGAHVFVAPCIPADDGNVDGLPTVVLEAMATGTPVIATAVTGLPEVIRDGDTGVLLEPGDVPGLAAALEDIASGRTDTARLAANARALIEDQFDSLQQAAVLSAWQRDKE